MQAQVPATFPYRIDEKFVKTISDASPSVTRAVSILGEILAVRAGRSGGRLVERSGPIHTAV